MITVEDAKSKLFKYIPGTISVSWPVSKSLGHVLAENIYSRIDIPQFDQSAVDGFVVCMDQPDGVADFRIIGEIKAGDPLIKKLKINTAMHIYTGAAVPSNASSIVMQEKVDPMNDRVKIPGTLLVRGSNIRLKGSQIRKGDLALKEGMILNPAAIGFLSMLGMHLVKVIRKPVVGILATGNELRKPGEKLLSGEIYESNSLALDAALRQSGFQSRTVKQVADRKAVLLYSLKKMISDCDVVIVSGGISSGKYDLVKETLEDLGLKEILYKVSQKPGKPMYIGKNGSCMVFALPGNPAASLVCFYEYVLPAMNKMSGLPDCFLKTVKLPLSDSFEAKGDRSLFLKARAESNQVVILDAQGSDMLSSFAEANALVYIPMTDRVLSKGEEVEVHLLPNH